MLKDHLRRAVFRQILSLEISDKSKQNVLDTIKILEKIDGIIYSGPNYIDRIDTLSFNEEPFNSIAYSSQPNDPKFGDLWGLTGLYGVNAPIAWQTTTGSFSVRVGVIDSGIANHEDLNANLAEGWDFVNNNSITYDDEDLHGTHLAGTIGAVGNNGVGITGVAQEITLVPLQTSYWDVEYQGYYHTTKDRINAIKYAISLWGTSEQISILNHSIGGFGTNADLLSVASLFPGLFVWSAGNDGTKIDNMTYNIDNVISVGAIDSNGNRSKWANNKSSAYGQAVNIYAPGSNIYSTLPGNKYGSWGGTSMAAPHVAGAAALLASYNPNWTGAELKSILLDNADEITIEGESAKLLNIGNVLWRMKNPDRIELNNVGYFSFNGDCNGGGRSGWKIKATNNQDMTIRVVYNKKMCFEGDAKNWTGLTDIDYFDLPAGSSRTVEVEENGTGTHIAFSYVYGSSRYITYANELNSGRHRIIPGLSTVSYSNDYENNGMQVGIAGKNGSTWLINLTNNTGYTRTFYYNRKMCFEGDAKYWTGLNDVSSVTLSPGATTQSPLEISENGTAGCIAISYTDGGKRNVFYAYDLNASGTMKTFGYTNPTPYTKNDMEVCIISKSGSTWNLQLTNRTGSTRTFQYNSKMCFEGDAQNWKLSADVKDTVSLANGAYTNISISENGTAGSIAISYEYVDEEDGKTKRKVFHACDLNASQRTMNAKSSIVDKSQQSEECIAAGTLITLADGTQKAVEDLTGDETLLVWNMATGTYDTAPILFIDSDPIGHYEVIELSFSDGTTVNVISEHGFWDYDLSRYVYLDENAEEYIGHRFNKQTACEDGTYGYSAVTLTGVEVSVEVTTAYSPVTYGHLCYYVNGMLSMPGGITGLFNIFDVDGETMTIDAEAYAADVAEYGLYTYEEFNGLYPIPEGAFEALNGQYLKVAVGKGLITPERIAYLAERYAEFF